MELLTISGSLRTGSFTTSLLNHAEELAGTEGHRVRRFERVAEIPPFNEDHEPKPPAVITDLRAAIHNSDAVLIATPEYSGSIPGQLKNLLDWAARPADRSVLIDRPAAVISASPSDYGAAWAREATEHILTQMGALVIRTGWGLPKAQLIADLGAQAIDADSKTELRKIIRLLANTLPR